MIELLTRGVVALERIAAALDHPVQLPAVSDALVACAHPADDRIDFGGMGESDGFHCRRCGSDVAPQPVGVS